MKNQVDHFHAQSFLPGPYEGRQPFLDIEGDDIQPASVFPHSNPSRKSFQRFVEDKQGGLVVAVQELDVDDVVHDVSLDHCGKVEGVGRQCCCSGPEC